MAHLSTQIFPKSLGFRTRVEVIYPQDPLREERIKAGQQPPPLPNKILYLLHGIADDATAWSRNTRIECHADARGYIVIMPEVQRSFYTDMEYGSKYFTYVTKELPQIMEELLNIKHQRESTFVAGLSMGGFVAMKCGLTRPDFYTAIAAFSGALDATRMLGAYEDGWFKELKAITSGEWPTKADDLFKLASKVNELPNEKKPRVLITCGEEDFLIKDNRKFNEHMQTLNIEYKYKEWPGIHDWKFWEESLPLAMDFFEKI